MKKNIKDLLLYGAAGGVFLLMVLNVLIYMAIDNNLKDIEIALYEAKDMIKIVGGEKLSAVPLQDDDDDDDDDDGEGFTLNLEDYSSSNR